MNDSLAFSREGTMSLTKPMLGLAVGGVLGLLDGLTGFFEPSLAPVMGSVITFSLLKGLLSGMALFWDILLPGMLLGAIVGFATQRFGRSREPAVALK
jgi:hypothetical protein